MGIDRNPGAVHSQHPTAAGAAVEDPDPCPGADTHLRESTSHGLIGADTRNEDHAGRRVQTLTHTITVAPHKLGNPN